MPRDYGNGREVCDGVKKLSSQLGGASQGARKLIGEHGC